MPERNEILIAEDEEEIRAAVVAEVRKIFPDLKLHEATKGFEALRLLHQFGDKILLVISDGMMGGNINAGEDVTSTAREKGVAHVALYSSGANTLRRTLEPGGIRCIAKTSQGEPHHELRAWIEAITERPQR